jgi:hypothetical protein
MARKIEILVIDDKGSRDNGKKFILTEMAADQGERWGLRALLALTNTGAAVPEEALGAGMAGLAAVGIQALGMLRADNVQPLLDELWPACVQYEHSAQIPPRVPLGGPGGDIEEVSTRITIYKALLKLHTGFSMPVGLPTSGSEISGEKVTKGNWLTQMSRALLGLLSHHALRP